MEVSKRHLSTLKDCLIPQFLIRQLNRFPGPFHGLSGLSSALPLLVLVAPSRISPRQGGV